MATARPRAHIAVRYEAAAQDYLRSLPLEHFMEAIPQATQRQITLESLELLKLRRPNVHVFNELLVQYPLPRQRRPGQVVPDNMVVVTDEPIEAEGSYNLPLEPARPFWVLEYVSKSNKRKDYDDNFDKYEQQLKVPYYLLFRPEDQELTLYHLRHRVYSAVKPNKHGRYEIPELEIEVALRDGWVRFWHRGELLPLPADLQIELDEARRQVADANRRADDAGRRADDAGRRADDANHLAAELQQRLQEAERELARLRATAAPPSPRPNGSKPSK